MRSGNLPAATELFGSALEMDRQAHQGLDRRNHDDIQRIVTPHLQRMEILFTSTEQAVTTQARATSLTGGGTVHLGSPTHPTAPSSSSPTVVFPYLVSTPIALLPDDCHLYSASILFNLGLSIQLHQPQSSQVPLFYHRATVVLYDVMDSNETFTMSVAILNNTAVWCHSNRDEEDEATRARSCVEQVAQLLAENQRGGESFVFQLDASVVSEQGVLANIRALRSGDETTTPTDDDDEDGTIFMASPAA